MAALHRQRTPRKPDPTFPPVPRKPGLDGLRALAVIALIVYHLDPSWLPGGFFGVDVFFVVSGYLITSLLVSEFGRFGTIDLKRFWLARACRVLPSVAVLLAAVILLACLFARDALPSLRTDVLFSLLSVINWWLIVRHVSEFHSTGRPPLLLHLWMLAVQGQFYLLWPPILAFLLRRVTLRLVVGVALVGAAASSWWMGVLYHPHLDPTRASLGTDSHLQGLFIGCALSIVVPPWAPRGEVVRSARRLLGALGATALAGLACLMAVVGQYSPFAYPAGFVLVDVCAAVLIVMVVHPGTWLAPAASLAPLRWVGTRAFALYLWHWPIIQLTRPHQDLHLAGGPLLIVRLVLIAVAAELSHRLVEVPFRRPEVWAGIRPWVRAGATGRIWAGLSGAVVVGLGALLLIVPGDLSPVGSLSTTATAPAHATSPAHSSAPHPKPSPAQPKPGAAHPRFAAAHPSVPSTRSGASTRVRASATTVPTTSTTLPPTTLPPTTPPTTLPPDAAALAEKEPILAVGDSVMLSARRALTATFGTEIQVDASKGRQVAQGVARLERYRATGQLARYRTVVIDLGTNGALTPALFDELVAALAGVPNVVFYNTYDDKPWEATTNATLAAGVSAHPGLIEINWAAAAHGPGIVNAAGTRSTPAGATAFASLLDTVLMT